MSSNLRFEVTSGIMLKELNIEEHLQHDNNRYSIQRALLNDVTSEENAIVKCQVVCHFSKELVINEAQRISL
ncbi:MAG: hypothetical protein APR54_10355 [Candidatus Cloacimonas sp. SDB]|nr:MAG: hypothetical protein APR54_10355 [Candidatus Cloacimonas sp. SDB]